MSVPINIIVIDKAGPTQLNEAHEIIKKQANGWWHRFTNCWIVGDHSPSEWRDWLAPVTSEGAAILVMRLPSEMTERRWATRGPESRTGPEWIRRNYKK